MNYNLGSKTTGKMRMFNPDKVSTISTTLLRRQHDNFQSESKKFLGAFSGGHTKRYQFYSWQYQGSKEEEVEMSSRSVYQAYFEWVIVESKTILEVNAVYTTTMLTLISQLHSMTSGIIAVAALSMVFIERIYGKYLSRLKQKNSKPRDDLGKPLMDDLGKPLMGDLGKPLMEHDVYELEVRDFHERAVDELRDLVHDQMNKLSSSVNERMDKLSDSIQEIRQQLQSINAKQHESINAKQP